jgi:hypothetical protein
MTTTPPLCLSLRAHPGNQLFHQIPVLVALYEPELELEAYVFSDFRHQVHGVADVAVVPLQLPFWFRFDEERFPLWVVSHVHMRSNRFRVAWHCWRCRDLPGSFYFRFHFYKAQISLREN